MYKLFSSFWAAFQTSNHFASQIKDAVIYLLLLQSVTAPYASWAGIGSLVPRCDLQALHCPVLPHCTLEFDIQPPASSQGSRRRTMSGSPGVPGASPCGEALTGCSAGDWGGNGYLRKPQGAGNSSSCWRGPFPHLGDLSRPSQGQPALAPPRHSALSQLLPGGPAAGLTSIVSCVLATLSPGVT